MKEKIHIHTDGSALGNPGPGGYGVVLRYKQIVKEMSAGYQLTTNNRMELLAVVVALNALNDFARDKEVIIYTDSKYVLNAVVKGWLFNWQKKNFKDKKNPDLWRRFLQIYPEYDIRFEWVKGHSGVPDNERCDVLAKEAAKAKNLLVDEGYVQQKDAGKLL